MGGGGHGRGRTLCCLLSPTSHPQVTVAIPCLYLLTPYRVDKAGCQAHYNVAHRWTRMVIECSFGLHFRCLHLSEGPPDADTRGCIQSCHGMCHAAQPVHRQTPVLNLEEGQGTLDVPPVAREPPHWPGQDPRGVAILSHVAVEYFT